jgi:glucose-6-phosphate 1-dehydrogenase
MTGTVNATGDDLSIVVIGASGDLARKKILPALFALYCQKRLPRNFTVFGFSRTPFTDEAFRARITEHLTCRYAPGESCAERMDEFLGRCHYVAGDYASPDAFLDLYGRMAGLEPGPATRRMFYLAIPPSVFMDVARSLGASGMVSCDPDRPWSRVVIEKPFGRDRESSDRLARELAQVFTEAQTFRIDHYLGKEMVQNLMVLRFANRVFEPIWSREHIRDVRISWKEDIGVGGRGGYFDAYGIIRDVVQNHLIQILALVAMERPAALDAAHIRERKLEALKAIPPVGPADLALGQYAGGRRGSARFSAYREEDGVAPDSTTPTFAAVAMAVRTPRWEGVPFLVRAGKGLDERKTEIRIRFREAPGNLFCATGGCPAENELVIRVQPDEAIYFKIVSKIPGLGLTLEPRHLDFSYKAAFTQEIPEAYESLLLDVIRGDRSLFIGGDELAAAWDIFTPALRELEGRKEQPESYEFGSGGPPGAAALAERRGVAWE